MRPEIELNDCSTGETVKRGRSARNFRSSKRSELSFIILEIVITRRPTGYDHNSVETGYSWVSRLRGATATYSVWFRSIISCWPRDRVHPNDAGASFSALPNPYVNGDADA